VGGDGQPGCLVCARGAPEGLLLGRADIALAADFADHPGTDVGATETGLDVADQQLCHLIGRAAREPLLVQVRPAIEAGAHDHVDAALARHAPVEQRLRVEAARGAVDDRAAAGLAVADQLITD
jgi:hypothetical protein